MTGGSGFIGHHLVAALKKRGDFVRVLDIHPRLDSFTDEFLHGSILDRDAVWHAMQDIDTVYHLAAIPHLWTADKRDFDRVNRGGTEVILSIAAELDVSRVIHCSSEATLLPRHSSLEITEAVTVGIDDMVGAYSRSKFEAEKLALAAARDGSPVIVVNPTIPIGPGDHNLTPPTAMLAMIVRQSLLMILDCNLNVVDVRDAVQGMMLAEDRGLIGERYLLGGENITLRELVHRVGMLLGQTKIAIPIPAFVALSAGKLAERVADNVSHRAPLASVEGVRLALRSAPMDSSKAHEELGYSPRAIGQSLAAAIAWLSNHGQLVSAPTGQWSRAIVQAKF